MANKVYQVLETGSVVTWQSSGGTESFMTGSPGALTTLNGRQGAMHDFGVAAICRRFAWRARIKPGATRVVGETIEVYLKTSDGTYPDNDDGTGDIALSAQDKLKNLQLLGIIQIDENAAVVMVAAGIVEILHRYAAPVFFNRTANSLSATEADYGFSLTPVVDEAQ